MFFVSMRCFVLLKDRTGVHRMFVFTVNLKTKEK